MLTRHGMRRKVLLLLTLVEATVRLLASWLLHLHRIHIGHVDIVNVLLILLLYSNVGRAMIGVFGAASPITGTTTTASASCAIAAIILVLVALVRSLVADAALTASALIADVATWIREVGGMIPVSRLIVLLLRSQITRLVIAISIMRVLPVLLPVLGSSGVVLLLVLTSRLDRHLGDLRFFRILCLLVLGVVTYLRHSMRRVNFSSRRHYELAGDIGTAHVASGR